jgi:hypothetical protein
VTKDQKIDDSEIILRRISEQVPSAKARHFKLRKDINETGVSCNRQISLDPQELLKGQRPDAWIAGATAGEIRKLGLEVIIVEAEGSPGHCVRYCRPSDHS